MPDTTAQPTMTAGAASYPPAYDAPGPALDRGFSRYLAGRALGSRRIAAVGRRHIETAIQRAEAGA